MGIARRTAARPRTTHPSVSVSEKQAQIEKGLQVAADVLSSKGTPKQMTLQYQLIFSSVFDVIHQD